MEKTKKCYIVSMMAGCQGGDSSQRRYGVITQGGAKASLIIALLFEIIVSSVFFMIVILAFPRFATAPMCHFCCDVFLRHLDHWSFEMRDFI